MFYSLAAAAVFSTLISTILSGIAYATFLSISSPTTGLAPVNLGAISCVALVALGILLHKEVRGGHQWPVWKTGMFGSAGVYLLVADVSSAGTLATNLPSPSPSGLRIACSVFWATSFLMQGLYYGYLLVQLTQKKSDPIWPRSFSQELKTVPESPSSITPPPASHGPHARVAGFDTRRSSLRKFPRRSNRYSGGTLCLQDPKEAYHDSFDTSSIPSPEPSPTQGNMALNPFIEQDTRPLLRGNGSVRSMPSLRREPSQQCLDSLSPTASTFNLESPSQSTFDLADSREDNIHPLFRSTSPSPSPTPTLGTMVKGSPAAGQTITRTTLTRMRSARSLREQNMRTPSPLPESRPELVRQDSGSGLSLSYVRWGTSQYKRRYDLNESPEEK